MKVAPSLKKIDIILVHRKGGVEKHKSNIHVSLLCVVHKFFTKVILNCVSNRLEFHYENRWDLGKALKSNGVQ